MKAHHDPRSLRHQFSKDAGKASKYACEIAMVTAGRPSSRTSQSGQPASTNDLDEVTNNATTSVPLAPNALYRPDTYIRNGRGQVMSPAPYKSTFDEDDRSVLCKQDGSNLHKELVKNSVEHGRADLCIPTTTFPSHSTRSSSTISYVYNDHGPIHHHDHLDTALRVINSSAIASLPDASQSPASTLPSATTPPPVLYSDDPDLLNPAPYTPNHPCNNRDSTTSYVQHDYGVLQPYYNTVMHVANTPGPSWHVPSMSSTYREQLTRCLHGDLVFDGAGPVTRLHRSRSATLYHEIKNGVLKFLEARVKCPARRGD